MFLVTSINDWWLFELLYQQVLDWNILEAYQLFLLLLLCTEPIIWKVWTKGNVLSRLYDQLWIFSWIQSYCWWSVTVWFYLTLDSARERRAWLSTIDTNWHVVTRDLNTHCYQSHSIKHRNFKHFNFIYQVFISFPFIPTLYKLIHLLPRNSISKYNIGVYPLPWQTSLKGRSWWKIQTYLHWF